MTKGTPRSSEESHHEDVFRFQVEAVKVVAIAQENSQNNGMTVKAAQCSNDVWNNDFPFLLCCKHGGHVEETKKKNRYLL